MDTSDFESLTGQLDLSFPEYEAPPLEPIMLVLDWLAAAAERSVREPRALALATADRRGRPSTRIVELTEVNLRGLVFATHTTSRKSREIAETGWASGLLYWRETGQQISVGGPVEQLTDAESEAMWSRRPAPLHPMSTASHQSDPIEDPATLLAEADRLAAVGAPLPRPDRFAGYRLIPTEVEFWAASANRLHRRLRYDRHGHDGWHTSKLQP
jgi:pyridoxamine 5'-phosphate oxidase